MENRTLYHQEVSTCLEDPDFAQAIRRERHQAECGVPENGVSDEKNGLQEAEKSVPPGRGIVGCVTRLHPCSGCMIRRLGEEKPGSLFSALHRWHKTWWPGWKIHLYENRVRAGKRASVSTQREGGK